MKKIVFLIMFVFAFGNDFLLNIGANKLDNSFEYKGTNTKFKDIGIDKLYNIQLKANVSTIKKFPDIYLNLSYFTSFTQNHTLTKNIIIDNTAFGTEEKISSKFSFTNINLALYYPIWRGNNFYLNLGGGFYGIIGSLKVSSNADYTNLDFKFYYPGAYLDYKFFTQKYQLGYNVFANLDNNDRVYTLNIYGGYYLSKNIVFNIGFKHTKMKIEDYDRWYSDLTTSGVYLEMSKKF